MRAFFNLRKRLSNASISLLSPPSQALIHSGKVFIVQRHKAINFSNNFNSIKFLFVSRIYAMPCDVVCLLLSELAFCSSKLEFRTSDFFTSRKDVINFSELVVSGVDQGWNVALEFEALEIYVRMMRSLCVISQPCIKHKKFLCNFYLIIAFYNRFRNARTAPKSFPKNKSIKSQKFSTFSTRKQLA